MLKTLLAVASSLLGLAAFAESTTIAVASNFAAPMRELVSLFEQHTDHQVKLVFGSSGKLFAQINHGAPFHGFFSADQAKAIALEQSNMAVSNSRFTYAQGQLALWSANENLVDTDGKVLSSDNFNKLALANPKLAPYGAAAQQALTSLQLVDATQSRWVQGENIAQTFQFVASGNAELGFVAVAQIQQAGEIKSGSAWIVPSKLHEGIFQDAVLLNKGKDNIAALNLIQFVKSESALNIIRGYGYLIPSP